MFTINGELWFIKFVSPYNPMLYRSDGSRSVAAADDATNTIYINNTLDGLFLKKVLCHEITHAAMFVYHIQLSIDNEELLADLIATYGEEIIDITNILFEKLRRSY